MFIWTAGAGAGACGRGNVWRRCTCRTRSQLSAQPESKATQTASLIIGPSGFVREMEKATTTKCFCLPRESRYFGNFFPHPTKKKFSEKNQEDAGTDQCRHGNAPESWLLLTAKYRDGAWWHYVIGQPFRSFSHGIICLLFLTCSSSISLTAACPSGSLWRCTLIESKLNVEIFFF